MKKLLYVMLCIGTISINADMLDYYMTGVLPSLASSNADSNMAAESVLTFDTNGAYDILDYSVMQNAHQTYQTNYGIIIYRDTLQHSDTSFEIRDSDEYNNTISITQDTIETTKITSVTEINGDTSTLTWARHVDLGDWVTENLISNAYVDMYEKCRLDNELSTYQTFVGTTYVDSILELTCFAEGTIKYDNSLYTNQYKAYLLANRGVLEYNYADTPDSNFCLIGTELQTSGN